mmetsp:Transcript_46428/g.110604  ORF Transcript_46428/g.110604 Transcript_46428/m.110604 type:complete len:314 (+) Transcript_46428:113-1054(+)
MRTFHAAAALALLALPAVSAFAPGAFAPSVRGFTAARSAVTLRAAPRVARSAIFSLRAQDVSQDDTSVATFQAGKKLSLRDKEKLYIDCCAAFNVEKKSLITDEEFEDLKTDLEFEGSQVMMMSREEIKFLVAKNKYNEGTPIISDDEFEALRMSLLKKGSLAPKKDDSVCRLDADMGKTVCKSDLFFDTGKNIALFIPPMILAGIICNEGVYWTGTGLSPLASIIVASPFTFIIGYVVTKFVLFQDPLVTKFNCPECSTTQNLYFGDILFNKGGPTEEMTTDCINTACTKTLIGNRRTMRIMSEQSKPKAAK